MGLKEIEKNGLAKKGQNYLNPHVYLVHKYPMDLVRLIGNMLSVE
jgi:hypothetical protein